MKCIVAVVVSVMLLSSCVVRVEQPGQVHDKELPVIPSKQIGDVIIMDAETRDDMSLFPTIEGFQQARFTVVGDGRYEVEVVTDGGRLSAVNNDTVAVDALCDFIYNFELYRESREVFEKRWRVVAYDDPGFPITTFEVNIIRNRTLQSACGGGCLLLGAFPIALLTMVAGGGSPSGEGDMNWAVGSVVIIGGTVGTVLVGSTIGNAISSRSAVKKIAESRRLKPVP